MTHEYKTLLHNNLQILNVNINIEMVTVITFLVIWELVLSCICV